MKKAKVRALLEREKQLARDAGRAEGARSAREQYLREYERTVALPKQRRGEPRPFIIGKEPDQRFCRLLVGPDVPFDLDLTQEPAWAFRLRAEEFVFRAVRQCHQLHTGHVVHWWTWELAR